MKTMGTVTFNEFSIRVSSLRALGASIDTFTISFLLPQTFTLTTPSLPPADNRPFYHLPIDATALNDLQLLLLDVPSTNTQLELKKTYYLAAKLTSPHTLGSNATYQNNGFTEELNYTMDFFGLSRYKYQRYKADIFRDTPTSGYTFQFNLINSYSQTAGTSGEDQDRPYFSFGRTFNFNSPWVVGPSIITIVQPNTFNPYGQIPVYPTSGTVDLQTSISLIPTISPNDFDDAEPNFFALQQRQSQTLKNDLTGVINAQSSTISSQISSLDRELASFSGAERRELQNLQRKTNTVVFFVIFITLLGIGLLLALMIVLVG